MNTQSKAGSKKPNTIKQLGYGEELWKLWIAGKKDKSLKEEGKRNELFREMSCFPFL